MTFETLFGLPWYVVFAVFQVSPSDHFTASTTIHRRGSVIFFVLSMYRHLDHFSEGGYRCNYFEVTMVLPLV